MEVGLEKRSNISHNSSYVGSVFSTACRDIRLGMGLVALAKDIFPKELL